MADFVKKVEDDILEKEIEHDQKVIERKEADETKHEAELKDDKSKFMKDLREDEIKHDEKVIASKETHEAAHRTKLDANEEEIKKASK